AILRRVGGEFPVVLCSRPEQMHALLPILRTYAARATVIYDTVDLHWLRLERQAALCSDQAGIQASQTMKAIEVVAARAADVVITVSDTDRARLRVEAPEARIEVVP